PARGDPAAGELPGSGYRRADHRLAGGGEDLQPAGPGEVLRRERPAARLHRGDGDGDRLRRPDPRPEPGLRPDPRGAGPQGAAGMSALGLTAPKGRSLWDDARRRLLK